jgi:hypothetical protein
MVFMVESGLKAKASWQTVVEFHVLRTWYVVASGNGALLTTPSAQQSLAFSACLGKLVGCIVGGLSVNLVNQCLPPQPRWH